MEINNFTFLANPKLLFGPGCFNELPEIIEDFGNTVLIITGSSSLENSGRLKNLESELKKNNINYYIFRVEQEPSPDIIDYAVAEFRNKAIHLVVSIGGGSVIDAGKAISAMLPQKDSVINYLEVIGKSNHNGIKAPFIAVPTTAGTGSEATKNAVLSVTGKNGFKKSLRHDNLIPDIALIDPELTVSCTKPVTAASGMDAFAQLLESYLSLKASPITDTLAWNGLEILKESLMQAFTDGSDIKARCGMSYAAYLSGITLTNAGLGALHGIAGVIGGYFEIPHGVACGTLMASVNRTVIRKLNTDSNNTALKKYANIGRLFTGDWSLSEKESCTRFIEILKEMTVKFGLPLLSDFGIKKTDAEKIASETDCKNNPVKLNIDEIKSILLERIQ